MFPAPHPWYTIPLPRRSPVANYKRRRSRPAPVQSPIRRAPPPQMEQAQTLEDTLYPAYPYNSIPGGRNSGNTPSRYTHHPGAQPRPTPPQDMRRHTPYRYPERNSPPPYYFPPATRYPEPAKAAPPPMGVVGTAQNSLDNPFQPVPGNHPAPRQVAQFDFDTAPGMSSGSAQVQANQEMGEAPEYYYFGQNGPFYSPTWRGPFE